jgi:hypothetical protein
VHHRRPRRCRLQATQVQGQRSGQHYSRLTYLVTAPVFRRHSPPTRSRRSTGRGRESSNMLTSVEGNATQGGTLL